jgi:hypothetical protein
MGFAPQQLFPLLRLQQLPPAMLVLLQIEVAREAATLVLLGAAAWIASSRATAPFTAWLTAWLWAFFLAFGVWDLAFYLWLRVLIGWPQSLMTWDVLFLIPVPWAAPVLAPVIVAVTMSIFGGFLLIREPQALRVRAGVLLAAGLAVIFTSFVWDWRRLLEGANPAHYPWIVFGAGEALLIAAFLDSVRRTSARESEA